MVTHGPDGTPLDSTYKNRGNNQYLQSLGRTIRSVAQVVPDGLLVFFPSYPVLKSCQEAWQLSGLWDAINQVDLGDLCLRFIGMPFGILSTTTCCYIMLCVFLTSLMSTFFFFYFMGSFFCRRSFYVSKKLIAYVSTEKMKPHHNFNCRKSCQ